MPFSCKKDKNIYLKLKLCQNSYTQLLYAYLEAYLFRLDGLFDAIALAVDPQSEAKELVGKVARNPVTGRTLPGILYFTFVH